MGLGDSLRKWAGAKAAELLTADSGRRADASADAAAAQQQAKADVGEQLFRAAFPKVAGWADEQEADRLAREQGEEQERRDEIAALPLADVQISVTGHATGHWAGRLHCSWEDVPAGEPDPTDPYADQQLARLDLHPEEAARPDLGGLLLTRWSFQLPGYRGDGSYDLTAIAKERETAGAALDYLEWAMELASSDDSSFYFHPGAPQSSVTVSEGGRRLSVVIGMSGALGELVVTAEIDRSPGL